MRIQKKRINSLHSNIPASLQEKPFVVAAIVDTTKGNQQLINLGFTKQLAIGETMLPPIIGSVSQFNAEGKDIPDKTKPKVTKYHDRYWTRQQWAGRGKTKEVTEIVSIPYKSWQKNHIQAPSVEITISKIEDGVVYITTPSVSFVDADTAKHTINLMLELFGYCDLLSEDGVPVVAVTRNLNWQILPPGERPWSEQKELLFPLFQKIKSDQIRPVIDERLEDINSLEPDFTALGSHGYQGYVVFGFKKKNIYVLESALYGNAIYILNEDWKELSQKSKADILKSGNYIERITHKQDKVEIINKIKKLIQ